jgi:hypothetical protein
VSIFNFTKKLLPRIDRSQVSEDLRMTEKEVSNIVIPCWETAAAHFKLNKPGSPEFEDLNKRFARSFDYRNQSKSQNFIQDIEKRLPNLLETVTVLREAVEKDLEKDILSAGLTSKKAFILRSVSNLSFITRYIPSLLNYLYTVEAAYHDKSLEDDLKISKGDMAFIDRNFDRFVRLFGEYTMSTKDFKGVLIKTPEVALTPENQEMVMGLYKQNEIDPFSGFGVSGFVGSVIYRIRLPIAKWQNDRYEAAKAKKQQLELRLLYLEMQKSKETTPALVEDIARLQERIEGYDRYLREVEESLEEDR